MSNTNLDDAIRLLSELRIAEDIPTYYKPIIAKIINTVDAEPIVRCKDCKYWEVDNDVGFCVRTEDCDWNADDFCSSGARKDD